MLRSENEDELSIFDINLPEDQAEDLDVQKNNDEALPDSRFQEGEKPTSTGMSGELEPLRVRMETRGFQPDLHLHSLL